MKDGDDHHPDDERKRCRLCKRLAYRCNCSDWELREAEENEKQNKRKTMDIKHKNSAPFSISKEDIGKIIRGAAIAVAGAIITWAGASFLPALENGKVEWRTLGFLLSAAVVSALVNAGRKWISGNS